MVQFADDPRTELDRKAVQLKWVAMVETVSYCIALSCMFIVKIDGLTKITWWFHGWFTVALIVMVVWIFPSINWRWYWVPLSLAPVIGGILLFEKIRRDGAPPRTRPLFERVANVRNPRSS